MNCLIMSSVLHTDWLCEWCQIWEKLKYLRFSIKNLWTVFIFLTERWQFWWFSSCVSASACSTVNIFSCSKEGSAFSNHFSKEMAWWRKPHKYQAILTPTTTSTLATNHRHHDVEVNDSHKLLPVTLPMSPKRTTHSTKLLYFLSTCASILVEVP